VLSVALHGALVAGVLALAGGTAPTLLFVDLVHEPRRTDEVPVGAPEKSAAAPRPRRSVPARPASPPPVAPSPAAPSPPSPAPAEPVAIPPAPVPPPAPTLPSVASAPGAAPPASVARPAPLVGEPPPGPPGPGETFAAGPGPGDGGAASGVGDGRREGPASDPGGVTGGGDGTMGAMPGASPGSGVTAGVGAGRDVALAAPGAGAGEATDYAGFHALLRRRLQETLRYPAVARRRGLSGTVHVDIDIAPSGAIGRVALATSSSHRVLDEAALEAVRAIEHVPFPAGIPPRHLRVRVPVVFDLR
jgi:TonB family protein